MAVIHLIDFKTRRWVRLIKDVTGVVLTPGNMGNDCLGNGEHGFEICCDECDYLICCVDESYPKKCAACLEDDCPRKNDLNQSEFFHR